MDEIEIVEYDPNWPKLFTAEARYLCSALGDAVVGIEHVGSTAVPGLAAKPVLDILVSIRSLTVGEQAVPALESIGYEFRGENGIPGRLFFRKRKAQGIRTHHLHMVEPGHEQWEIMRQFRDYLSLHPEEAQNYQALKRELAHQFWNNRLAYTDGKASYIQAVLAKIREETRTIDEKNAGASGADGSHRQPGVSADSTESTEL